MRFNFERSSNQALDEQLFEGLGYFTQTPRKNTTGSPSRGRSEINNSRYMVQNSNQRINPYILSPKMDREENNDRSFKKLQYNLSNRKNHEQNEEEEIQRLNERIRSLDMQVLQNIEQKGHLKNMIVQLERVNSALERDIDNIRERHKSDKMNYDREKLKLELDLRKSNDELRRLVLENKAYAEKQEQTRKLLIENTLALNSAQSKLSKTSGKSSSTQYQSHKVQQLGHVKKFNCQFGDSLKYQMQMKIKQRNEEIAFQNKIVKKFVNDLLNKFNEFLHKIKIYETVYFGKYTIDKDELDLETHLIKDYKEVVFEVDFCRETLEEFPRILDLIHDKIDLTRQKGKIDNKSAHLKNLVKHQEVALEGLIPLMQRLVSGSETHSIQKKVRTQKRRLFQQQQCMFVKQSDSIEENVISDMTRVQTTEELKRKIQQASLCFVRQREQMEKKLDDLKNGFRKTPTDFVNYIHSLIGQGAKKIKYAEEKEMIGGEEEEQEIQEYNQQQDREEEQRRRDRDEMDIYSQDFQEKAWGKSNIGEQEWDEESQYSENQQEY